MILFVVQLLDGWGIKVPAAFSYYSTRMILALLTSLIVTIFFGDPFIRWLSRMRIGQSIRQEECPKLGELHQKKQNTPTMGGLLLILCLLVSLFLWMDLAHGFTWILLITTLFLGMVGGVDDYLKLRYKNAKGLSARGKFYCQILLSGGLAFYLVSFPGISLDSGKQWPTPPVIKEQKVEQSGKIETSTLSFSDYLGRIYLPFFKKPVFQFHGFLLFFSLLLIIFVITGSSNAVNLTDGLDGLAAGCLMMVALCLSLVAFLSNHIDFARYLNILYIEGSGEIAIYLAAFGGACLGFLWYNGFPAQVFMGDIGSLTLGGVLGVSAVLLRREFLLGIIGGIFVMEALSVMIQVASYRLRNKQRVFLCAPIHHHFEYKGWPETRVVMRFWIIGLILAMIGIISLKFQ